MEIDHDELGWITIETKMYSTHDPPASHTPQTSQFDDDYVHDLLAQIEAAEQRADAAEDRTNAAEERAAAAEFEQQPRNYEQQPRRQNFRLGHQVVDREDPEDPEDPLHVQDPVVVQGLVVVVV